MTPHLDTQKKDDEAGYFSAAQSWADDYYALAVASRNRYQKAFLGVLGLCGVLAFGVIFLLVKQQVQLIVVHEGESGYEWISTVKTNEKSSESWLKTRSEIARYINARESYDPILYAYQTKEVQGMSHPSVFSDYEAVQDAHNKNAPVNLLGARGYRTIQILNVLLIDKIPEKPTPGIHHENLAEVSFLMEDHSLETNQVMKKPYTVMISWRYQGTPRDPERLFKNWDGFEVVKYDIQPVVQNVE